MADVLAVDIPGQSVEGPSSNVIWAIIGGFILIALALWVISQISKRFFVVVALVAVFVLVVLFANGTIGGGGS